MNPLLFILYFAVSGAGISLATLKLFQWYILKNLSKLLNQGLAELKSNGYFDLMLSQMEIGNEIKVLADSKLDNLVSNFKDKVPMVGMFLTGELEKTLKNLAKEELMGMVPEIQDNMKKKLNNEFFIQEELCQSVSFFLKNYTKSQFISLFALFGLFSGLFFGLFYLFLNKL